MRTSVAVAHGLVSGLEPGDAIEAAHRAETLRWLASDDDVYRRVKPATPAKHLVSYVAPRDPVDGSLLLVDHVNAGLWLPPGGHVDVDEHPAATARRELGEELGLRPEGADVLAEQPAFLTVTRTVGMDAGHTDVSLWFVFSCSRGRDVRNESGEFRRFRWWTPAELRAADPAGFDPHLGRFLDKLG